MIFNAFQRDEGCQCAGCGQSPYEGMGTPVQRADGQWEMLMVCAGCLFKAAIGEKKFNAFLGKTDAPKRLPPPEAIAPRFFG